MKSKQDLDKFIREKLKAKRPELTTEKVEEVVKFIGSLSFMQSPEAIETFINTVKQ